MRLPAVCGEVGEPVFIQPEGGGPRVRIGVIEWLSPDGFTVRIRLEGDFRAMSEDGLLTITGQPPS